MASALTMSAFHGSSHFTQPPTQAPSPPRSQPPSPVISRKPLPETPTHAHTTSTACPSCGHSFSASASQDAQRTIADLQAQVKLLNSKAAAAVDKLADYEDEVRMLRAERGQHEGGGDGIPPQPQINPPPAMSPGRNIPPQQQSRLSSLRSLLGGQRRNPSDSGIGVDSAMRSPGYGSSFFASASQPHLPQPFSAPEPTLHSLQSDLASEREMRLKAETNLTETQMELEELTAQLFGQANEMVAEERKARSKLEERVRILERREKEKGERLKKLETRIERVERVRAMVG